MDQPRVGFRVDALRPSPAAGAVWETFVFAQLRYREGRACRARSRYYRRDRKPEMDLVVESAGFPGLVAEEHLRSMREDRVHRAVSQASFSGS